MEFKRPLLYVALLYGGGVVLADHLSLSLAPLFTGALGLALVSLVWARARPILLGPLIFVTGYTNLLLHTVIISPFDLRVGIGDRVEQYTVRGTLTETPFHRVYEHGQGQESWRTLAQVEVNSIRLQASDWQPAVGRIVVSTPGIVPDHF